MAGGKFQSFVPKNAIGASDPGDWSERRMTKQRIGQQGPQEFCSDFGDDLQ